MKELHSIVDYSQFDPAIDSAAFPGTPTSFFWTASQAPGSASQAAYVNFNGGGTGATDPTDTLNVRCVR
jgi:hypothetical protein